MRHLLTALLCLFTYGFAATPTAIKIGIIAPFSGENAYCGQDVKDGFELAKEEFSNTSLRYELIYEDDRLQPRLANLAARKLISADKVDVLFSFGTSAATVVGLAAEKAQVVHFNTSWNPEPAERFRWTLIHGTSHKMFAEKMVKLLKKDGYKRLGIVALQEQGNNEIIAFARPLLKDAGIPIVFYEPINPTTLDLRGFVLKLREANPDFIWCLFLRPHDVIFWKEASQLGVHWPSTGYYDYASPEVFPFIEGSVFPSELFSTPGFAERFSARFGHPPVVRAGHAYDIYRLIVEASEARFKETGRAPTHAELLERLQAPRELTDLAVGRGTMHANGWLETHLVLRQIKNGKIVDVPAQ